MKNILSTKYTNSWRNNVFKLKGNYPDIIDYIDSKFDPLRTLFNQICRIFSGSITEKCLGSTLANNYILPVILTAGIISNGTNALYKSTFFYKRKGWKQYWPYLSLSLAVITISIMSLVRYTLNNFDTSCLRYHGIPLSIICGSIQLCAECWNLLDRHYTFTQAKEQLIIATKQYNSITAAKLTEIYFDCQAKLKSLRTKHVIIKTLLCNMVIGWASNLFRTEFLNFSTEFSIFIASIGIFLTLSNYFKNICYKQYLNPNQNNFIQLICKRSNNSTQIRKALNTITSK